MKARLSLSHARHRLNPQAQGKAAMITSHGNFYATHLPGHAGVIMYLVVVRNYPERVYKIAWHNGSNHACYGGTTQGGLTPFPQFKSIANALIFVDKAGGKAVRFKRSRHTPQALQALGVTSLVLSSTDEAYSPREAARKGESCSRCHEPGHDFGHEGLCLDCFRLTERQRSATL